MQSVPASGCWQMFRSAFLSASSDGAMTSSTFVAVNRVWKLALIPAIRLEESESSFSAWAHLGHRAPNAVPYITALWGVRARLTSSSDEKRGACLRFGGGGAAADPEPVREGNGGGRSDDEELSAAHTGDQNGRERNPQQRKYRPRRETKHC